MRIIQITDLHIYQNDELVNGVDTRSNFKKVLAAISNLQYDLVVITGDLCYSDGDKNVYKWIKSQLDEFKIKNYNVIGGNHDSAIDLAEVFELAKDVVNDELYYHLEPDIIFLDTIKGYCSDEQIKWFEEKIKSIKESNPIIFMHHPPFKSGVPHMDRKYAFKQPELFNSICSLNKKKSFVFTGHYHNEISLINDNVNMFITPSTYVQIDLFEEDFKTSHSNPAFRVIDIDNSQIKTTVRYVFD